MANDPHFWFFMLKCEFLVICEDWCEECKSHLLWFSIKPVRAATSLLWPDKKRFLSLLANALSKACSAPARCAGQRGLLCELCVIRSARVCLSLSHLVWLVQTVWQTATVTSVVGNLSRTHLNTVEDKLRPGGFRADLLGCPAKFHSSLHVV